MSVLSSGDSPGLDHRKVETTVLFKDLSSEIENYRSIIDAIDVGFCIIEMLFDADGHAYDYRFIQGNPAFERHTGLADAMGKTIREMVPEHDAIWFETYGNVALTGEAIRFEDHAHALNRTYDVHAQRIGEAGQHLVAVFFSDISDRKQLEREKDRLAAREHNIAVRLQEALQPSQPPTTPELSLAEYYRPALAEAGVGGDFYDVFTLSNGCVAFVVGDLSGKGLSAASEVATVRNMTRYALYSDGDLSATVTRLHSILSENNLLTGFATLFVGIFEAKTNTVRYVNCGQEPALLWRAQSASVELLSSTGPVLGGFTYDDVFGQGAVTLAPGDVFAAFTDGLTDVGPSRKHLLGISGVAALFHECCASHTESRGTAKAVRDCLVAKVESYGQSRFGDDIALLVGTI